MTVGDEQDGEAVTVRGTAGNARAGAIVRQSDGLPVYIDGLEEWAEELAGKQVVATGLLRARPSLIPDPPGPLPAHGLGATLALEDASWAPDT